MYWVGRQVEQRALASGDTILGRLSRQQVVPEAIPDAVHVVSSYAEPSSETIWM
jgi:hypothetical protein